MKSINIEVGENEQPREALAMLKLNELDDEDHVLIYRRCGTSDVCLFNGQAADVPESFRPPRDELIGPGGYRAKFSTFTLRPRPR